jgi:N-methylhydantoinase A/oxoprolinase/acetone carboxylase beta subunit
VTNYNIGIDTGGTYTDAVVVDLKNRKIAATAKAITTHGNLSIGVNEALGRVIDELGDNFPHGNIKLVSLSTTLATNALVEGRGSSIASILIGFDDGMAERTGIAQAIPSAQILRVDGGHTHNGDEDVALDEKAIREATEALREKVDAIAIAARYSVRNPAHERRAEEIVHEILDCPVTVSCDLSDALDGPRRALTAALNARIVSRIVKLVAAANESLQKYDISAPLMIVKGDGSLVSAGHVVEAPIETILSGPAASVIGARFLSRRMDFVVSDIGGTTTDIAIARNGWPRLNDAGSEVGGYRTLVQAIDMRTSGLGGDSEIETDYNGKVELKSNRAVPISLLGARWPRVTQHLLHVLSAGKGLRTACKFVLRPEGYDKNARPADLADDDLTFLERITEEPVPYASIVNCLSDEKRVALLADRGFVQLGGFTPSDAAHALGLQDQWSQETARLACLIAGRTSEFIGRNEKRKDAESKRFAELVLDKVVTRSTHLIIEELAGRRFEADNPLVSAVSTGKGHLDNLGVKLHPDIPVIGVGGPAPLYYPEVGKRLGCETIVPEYSEVANAIGAAAGLIKVRSVVEVTQDEDGAFHVHGHDDPTVVSTGLEALSAAKKFATEHAENQSREMGGHDLQTEIDVQRIDLPNVGEDLSLIGATVTAECTSIPWRA